MQSLGRASSSMIFFCWISFSIVMIETAEIGAVLQVVDHDALDLRAESLEQQGHEIVGQRTFPFSCPLMKHANGAADNRGRRR